MKDYHLNFDEAFLIDHVGNLTQIGGLKHYYLGDGKAHGVEAVDITTGSGLVFTVLPGRGMDIAWASYKGLSLAYISKTGIASPVYYESDGMKWLRTFFAGLLTTCGLSNVGDPCTETRELIGEINHGLHGRISNSGAEQVCCSEEWKSGKYVMSVSGKMREAVLHGENVTLRRTISCCLGDRSFTLHDTVKNEGRYDHHLMLLYHVNFGYPLLDADSRIIINSKKTTTTKGDPVSGDNYRICHVPEKRAAQYGYSHELAANKNGMAKYALVNNRLGIGLAVEYEKSKLPKFNQWSSLSTGEYIQALEPGTCLPITREEVERRGEALVIRSREEYETKINFSILDGEDEINAFEEEVMSL
jgi:hypothetical protein